jgi:demethoxyubiquinone hydroxylase (CLK1/Coq7/Cat5 family)
MPPKFSAPFGILRLALPCAYRTNRCLALLAQPLIVAERKMPRRNDQQQLVHILHSAYSGEMAAALAYRGHWQSLRDTHERARVRQIEREEWRHRRCVGAMLRRLQAEPQKAIEAVMWLLGYTVGVLCHVSGWFWPMYFAGKLESGNVREYELAAACARRLALTHYERRLRKMAEVEQEHESFFREVSAGHWLPSAARKMMSRE